jgi:hypothetical protein
MGYLLFSVKKTFRNLYVLTFLNGFLIASLFYFRMLSVYENGLFSSIKSSIGATLNADDTPDSIFIKSMNSCYTLMHNRANVFMKNEAKLGPQGGIFRSTAIDLNTADGACGSYSEVLARLLKTFDYKVRIGQMMADGKFGAHVIVEAYTGSRWVALDPSYNLYFVRPDSRLAGIADIRGNWGYYSHQTPAGYNPKYRYEQVRYTNWSKIPILMPALKQMLTWTIGEQRTNGISLRVLFLNVYDIYFYIILAMEICLLLMTIRIRVSVSRRPAPLQLNPGF